MNPRIAFAIAAAVLFVATPAMAGRPADSTPPMLTINQLAKVCTGDKPDDCGPTYYVDWDGKIYRESNKRLNLQREDTLDGAVKVSRDSLDILP